MIQLPNSNRRCSHTASSTKPPIGIAMDIPSCVSQTSKLKFFIKKSTSRGPISSYCNYTQTFIFFKGYLSLKIEFAKSLP